MKILFYLLTISLHSGKQQNNRINNPQINSNLHIKREHKKQNLPYPDLITQDEQKDILNSINILEAQLTTKNSKKQIKHIKHNIISLQKKLKNSYTE